MADEPDFDSIFCVAVEIASAEDRAAYLNAACCGDAELLARLQRLVAAHFQAGTFLQKPAVSPSPTGLAQDSATSQSSMPAVPGVVIGPYKLIEQIGEGGMGTVWMAQQSEPVTRLVALKLIKAGMDSRKVIARFEAERQALAMMDHPNIAKVLDAGTTESGRPYFVMDLVRGVPITQYCDEHHLTPRQRLELFLPVCQAIQHAHQKGIIHRDIKPTNILVAEYDQQAVPKVIDFGVAKAIGSPVTEKTMFTGFGQLVGTLEYMSPEQAKLNQLDIDTRSDIYSLGVLLYELLTGSTPFDKQRLRSAAWDEMLRIIREEEPERPSTRLSSVGSVHGRSRLPGGTSASNSSDASGSARQAEPTLASIAALRNTEPARLTKLVRGELDWIVMKALEKDRGRRYETASGLAADLQRYLNDEPVQACPPSAAYRLRKFARRNKRVLATASFIMLALLATLVTLAVSNVVISRERDAKTIALEGRQAALIQAQASKEAADKERQRAEDNLQLAVTVLDQTLLKPAERRLEISRRERGRLVETDPERLQLETELLEKGAAFYAQFAKHNGADPAAQVNAAAAHHWLAYYQWQMGLHEKSLETFHQGVRFLEDSTIAPRTQADIYHGMYLPLFAMKRFAEAEEVTRRGLAIYERLAAADASGRVHGCWRQLIWSNMNLGSVAAQTGRNLKAEQAFRKALAVSDDATRAVPEDVELRRDKALAGELLGAFYANTDRIDEAVAAWGAVAKDCNKLAQDTGEARFSWREAGALERVGQLHQKASRYQDAEKKYADALLIWDKLVTETNHPDYRYHLGWNRDQAGDLLKKMGRLSDAAAAYQAAITIWEKLVSEFNRPEHRQHLALSQGALKEVRSFQEKQPKDQVK